MKASSLLGLTFLAALAGGCGLLGRAAPAASVEATTAAPVQRPSAPALALDPQPPIEFRCGERRVELRHFGELATLGVDGKVFTLRPERSASGMRMVSVDDERTGIWVMGNSALLSLAGVEQLECRRVAEKPLFRAVGNEPAWRLDIGAQGLELIADDGASRAFASAPLIVEAEGLRSYQGTSAGGELEALVFERVCVDTMSGMTHPNTVEVRWQERVLRGCGGDPALLLQGEPWEVVELDGSAVADPARITLGFAAGGRLAGGAGCNRYFGSYALSGEGLRLSPRGATQMACAPRAMEDERRFMAAAASVSGFAITTDGRLELRAGERVVMRARRASGPR